MELIDEKYVFNLKFLHVPSSTIVVKEFVGNTMEFGMFSFAQADVIVFPPCWRAF